MTAINLPHGTTRSSDMSADVRYAWQGDTLTEHDLGTDGGTMSWKLWRDDDLHARFNRADGETEIFHDLVIAVINGRAYGIEVSVESDEVPLALIEPAQIPARTPSVPGLAWVTLAAILSRVDAGKIAEAEHTAHTALPQYRAAMLGLLAEATRLLATAEEQTPDAPLVIDPRINGLTWVSVVGESALEIHTDRAEAPEIYLIDPDGLYVRLPR